MGGGSKESQTTGARPEPLPTPRSKYSVSLKTNQRGCRVRSPKQGKVSLKYGEFSQCPIPKSSHELNVVTGVSPAFALAKSLSHI